jgi:hypothetical protein
LSAHPGRAYLAYPSGFTQPSDIALMETEEPYVSERSDGGADSADGWKTRLDSLDSVHTDSIEDETRPSVIERSKSGWYPGKYLGRSRPPEKKLSVQDDEMEGTKQDMADRKQEAMIVKTVRSIRLKFLERQLVGRIYIYRISGIIATAITSEVTRDDIMQHLLQKAECGGLESIIHDDPLMQAELEGKYKRALSTTDTILNSLERRSLSWEGCEFGANTLLTRGSTIGVSDPFIGMMTLSFTLELSATAHSLLASRKRYEATRELAACVPRPSLAPKDAADLLGATSTSPTSDAATSPAEAGNTAASIASPGDSSASMQCPAAADSTSPVDGVAPVAKKSSFFGFGSSAAKKGNAAAATAPASEADCTVEITEIYGEPVHSLAQVPTNQHLC